MMLNYLKSQGTKEQQRFWLEHARDGVRTVLFIEHRKAEPTVWETVSFWLSATHLFQFQA